MTKVDKLVLVVGARGIPDVEGGAEKNAEKLFPLVAEAGYRVVLLGLENHIKSDSYRGVELRGVPNIRMLNTDKIAYYLRALIIAGRLKPDIVHLQGLGASIFLWFYKMMGANVVVRYGSADYIVSKWGLIGRLGFRFAEYQTRFANAIIAVAPSLAARLAKRGIKSNVHVIANAIDGPEPGTVIERDPVASIPFVLMAGRVTAQKNVHNVVEGFKRFLAKSGANYRLAIAGGLEDEAYVDALKPELDETVILLGRCTRGRLEGLYRDCALYVNGSMHEGSSNAVLEAIGRGCPILLSGIPENRDFNVDKHVFFDPEDPDAIADAFFRALEDPDKFRADISRFMNWEMVAEKTLDVYRKILA